ncbi:hypothetical protein ANTRET_LOCUS10331 [Anthophora retusa]
MKYLLVVTSVICLFGLSVLGDISETTTVISSLREKRSPQNGPPPLPCDPNGETPCEPPMPPPLMAQMDMPRSTMLSSGFVSGKKGKRSANPPPQGQQPPGGGMQGAMDSMGGAMGSMASTMVDGMGSIASGMGSAMGNMGKRMENMG